MEQLKAEHKALKGYGNANLWLNLPVDQTTNAFLQSIGCASRYMLENALKQLEDTTSYEESIRAAVFQKREIPSTTPIPIAWEIADLLKEIYCVYTQNDFQESEAFAKEVFVQLVSRQQIAENKGLEEDYIRMNLLCNSGAQNQLLSSIKPAFQQRIDLVNKMIFTSTSVVDYQIALEFLDNLIAKLISMRGSVVNDVVEKENAKFSYTDELLKYYRDLVSVRSTLVPAQIDGMPSDVLYFDQSSRCANVVSRLERILSEYKRPVSDKVASEFLTCYKEYLCMQINPNKRKQAVDFVKTYTKIREYTYDTLPVEDFMEQMQKELYSYAKSVFMGLKEISLHGYVSTDYTPKAAADAHFRMRLIDIQKIIQDKIDEAIKQLKIAYTVFHYSTQINDEGKSVIHLPPSGRAEMNRLSDCMYYQSFNINREVLGMPDIDFNKTAQYAEVYNSSVVPMIGGEEISANDIGELLEQINCREMSGDDRWLATAKFLEYQCRVAVAVLIRDSVKQLKEEYIRFCSLVYRTKKNTLKL